MAKKLVIVESPAKAKTIRGYLGNDYEVEASVGHIRDLVSGAKALPEEVRKKWWADYGVDIDNDFQPFYEVPPEKANQVKKLRDAMKGKETLILATDEDREGEAISWHLLQTLRPPKTVKVERIAFHEITKDAILRALASPRKVDEDLVEAQETRRILDRLYGYTLSPVLWSRVTRNLSAGRVQSPAVKLIVERERERRDFRAAIYWDLRATFGVGEQSFTAELRRVDGLRVANGSDFADTTGQLRPERTAKVRWLDQAAAAALAGVAKSALPYRVLSLKEEEGIEKPSAPFMTTTLQQDANRKFGFAADRTMRIAQTLYEGVDVGGETVGLITYMRTDSLTLSESALESIRRFIKAQYPECLPAKPNQYASKVKNAQEAHEAIRPTDVLRRPADVERYLTKDQAMLYTLIWQRTVASQMKPSQVLRTEVEVVVEGRSLAPEAKELVFVATGKQLLFDGFRRVYLEGQEEEVESGDRLLPRMSEGQELQLRELGEARHETKPPSRFTDATLIKRLEELGIGRPSTYASIISVIVDRGYVRKAGRQLVPTFKAFMAHDVLQNNFGELMDLGFTARMDETLDEISEGKSDSKAYLREFFLGDDGLKRMVETRKAEIAYPALRIGEHPETGDAIVVRNGKDGSPFLQMGEGDNRKYANLPDDLAPADLTLEVALDLLSKQKAEAESVGFDPATGRRLLVKYRQGYYLEVERTPEEIEAKVKPRWVSVPPDTDPRNLSQEDLAYLCRLPLRIGAHPETGEVIEFKIGPYGAYIECGAERRTIEDWRAAGELSAERAVEILSQPKGRPAARAKAGPIQDFGDQPGAAGPVRILAGRFGPYVTDGETNATLPRGVDPATVSKDQALEILNRKREAGPSTPRATGKGRPKPTPARAVKKSAPPKSTAPKSPAKPATKGKTKSTPRKKTA